MAIISFHYSDDVISDLEHRIKYNEKLLSQALAFREECVVKGLVTLIPDCEKKIYNLRENLAGLSEQMVQAIESL
jgi:hypothetical protein